MTQTTSDTGTWRELLGQHLGTSTVLAGGVAMYATNEFLTVSLLPSTIAEIGGDRLYAWVVTLYLVGSVVAATTVNPILRRFGARSSFLLGLAVFGVASVACAVAPTMEVLIAGRTLQGVAGGTLAGLGYALINAALPRSLWTRGSALVSAMWGVATVVGPATGGLFAQFGLWRWAFGAMAVLAALLAILVPAVLAASATAADDPKAPALRVPVGSLLLVGAAALAVSVAQLPRNPAAIAALLAVAVLLVAAFVVVDRRGRATVLPASVFGTGPLKWIYLTLAVLMMAVHGGHLRAIVRSAVGTSDSSRGRVPRRLARDRLDSQRDRQRIAEQPSGDRPRRPGRAAADGGRAGVRRRHSDVPTRRSVALRCGLWLC